MLKNAITWFLGLDRTTKRLLLVSVDFLLIPAVLWMSFSVRLDSFYQPLVGQHWIFLAAPLIATPIFIRFGLYRAIVRYIGFKALWAVVQAVVLYSLIWSLLVLLTKVDGVPRSVYILNALFAIFFIGGSRMVGRWIVAGVGIYRNRSDVDAPHNVVIYGAGSAGVQLSAALSLGCELRPVAFIDDDVSMHNFLVHGLPVYPLSGLGRLIENKQVKEVLLALPSASA